MCDREQMPRNAARLAGEQLKRSALLGTEVRRHLACLTGLGRRRGSASDCRGFRPILALTDGAGGFLPGVPSACLGMGHNHLAPAPWVLKAYPKF
jgi:hypothetical protein